MVDARRDAKERQAMFRRVAKMPATRRTNFGKKVSRMFGAGEAAVTAFFEPANVRKFQARLL